MKKNTPLKLCSVLVAASVSLSACNSTNSQPTDETLQGNWHIEVIQDKSVIDRSPAHLSFHPENKLSGSASCNNLSSSYTVKGSSLAIGPIATTRRMCSPALMEQESSILQALGEVKQFQLKQGKLSLYDQRGTLQLQAKRTKE